MFDVLEILAALFLMLSLMRRLEVKSIRLEDQIGVSAGALEAWRQRALRAYRFTGLACLLKLALGRLWLVVAVARFPEWVVRAGGALVDATWVVALVIAWRQTTNVRFEQARLGVVRRRRQSEGS